MSENFRKMSIALLFGAVAATALSGCGRKGDPQAPGVYEPARQEGQAAATEDPAVDDKPFVLDPLL